MTVEKFGVPVAETTVRYTSRRTIYEPMAAADFEVGLMIRSLIDFVPAVAVAV